LKETDGGCVVLSANLWFLQDDLLTF